MCFWGSAIRDMQNYFGSEISKSKRRFMWSEIWGRRDYHGSDISSTCMKV